MVFTFLFQQILEILAYYTWNYLASIIFSRSSRSWCSFALSNSLKKKNGFITIFFRQIRTCGISCSRDDPLCSVHFTTGNILLQNLIYSKRKKFNKYWWTNLINLKNYDEKYIHVIYIYKNISNIEKIFQIFNSTSMLLFIIAFT